MPVTILPASHEAKRHPPIQPAASLEDFLAWSCPTSPVSEGLKIHASSFTGAAADLYPSSSSFIRSAIEAWGRHSHLVLRPDDMWFAILVQLNFYMQTHANELRDMFVSPSQEKRIQITIQKGGWPELMGKFRGEIQKSVKLPWLSEWISCGFTTSTEEDETTATVLLMGVAKHYFHYAGGDICGIPSISLLGIRSDWHRLLTKLDRLQDFGAEPTEYASRLRPLLRRVVETFDDPHARQTRDFWDQLVQAKVHHTPSCGVPPTQYFISGWILGFFYWDRDGKKLRRLANGWDHNAGPGGLVYDEVHYGIAPLDDVPAGYVQVPFEIIRFSNSYHGDVVAGSIGKYIHDSAPTGYEAAITEAATRMERESHMNRRKPETGCMLGLLRSLGCFRTDNKVEEHPLPAREMQERPSAAQSHSTIQPRSGWILYGPSNGQDAFTYRGNPFVDTEDYGPTVDAIESCDGVEHIRQ